ncbi:acyl-CoA dehydrogenase family protein [Nocardia sp. CA-120079]|uniref:acyl-CoA dehydrogenase family protein n=1 Tax=Nocardia sp. CA-120079 TaxID=3239974 RepID=UPI003D969C90
MSQPEAWSDDYQAAREEALSWLTANWDPGLTVRAWWAKLAESGWGFPTWPTEWFGRGLSADAAAGVRSAFPVVGALPPPAGLGQLLGAPMLMVQASEEQKAKYLPALARGEESWCQFFSEPGSGSDLASAQTRAVRDDDGWRVHGQKVWTSRAQWCDRGMLLARTDRDLPKHQGLTFFIIDVDQPGIEIRPLRQMNGDSRFNEVFFDGARVDDDRIVGQIGDGWSVALTVLMYERFVTSMPTARAGTRGGQLDELAGAAAAGAAAPGGGHGQSGVSKFIIDVAKELGQTSDPVTRQRLASLWATETTSTYLIRDGQSARDQQRPSARGSLAKLGGSRLARASRDTGLAVLGAAGMLDSPDTPGGGAIQYQALSSPGLTIAGGTDEIQRNIVSERLLELPKEARPDRDMPFKNLIVGSRPTE